MNLQRFYTEKTNEYRVYIENSDEYSTYRQLSVKEDMKLNIDKKMNKLVIKSTPQQELSRLYSAQMTIQRKNSDITRIVADFRYLKK